MHVDAPAAFPARPVLPPLLFAAIGLWVCAACGLSAMRELDARCDLGCAIAAIAASLALSAVVAIKGARPALMLMLGSALGLACACQASFVQKGLDSHIARAGSARYVFQIVEDVHESDYGLYSIARAQDEEGRTFRLRVNIPEGSSVKLWDVFALTCEIRPPSNASREYYWNHGLVGSVSPHAIDAREPAGPLGAVSRFRSAGIQAYAAQPGPGEEFMRSIVFGDRRDLFSSDLYGQVKRVGLAHLVAVSGAHLSIAIAAFGALLRLLRCPKAAMVCAQALACVLFVILTGAPHSALRACVMASCTLGAYFGKRPSFAINALSVCVIACIVLQPHLSLSVSLLLSSLATGGIVLLSQFFSAWLCACVNGRFQPLCDLLGMTLAAISATLLVSASLFGQMSLIAPVSNIAVTPVFALLCVGGIAASALAIVFPGFVAPVQIMCDASDLFCGFIEAASQFPYAATVAYVPLEGALVLTGLAFAFVLWRWPEPSPRIGLGAFAASAALAFALFVVLPASHETEIVMLDVGQGDAFVLRSGSRAVLVDTGNQDSAVLQGLARHDIRHLDAVLITHPDDDHCGSLEAILGYVEVDRVLVANDLLSCPCSNCASLRAQASGESLVGLHAGDEFVWGAFRAVVLHPTSFSDEGGNDDSVVLQVGIDADGDGAQDAAALFCGDAESEVLDSLRRAGKLGPADIYKVGHHGSAGAVSDDQLALLKPRIALISVGKNNRYGHPSPDTLSALERAGCALWRSDESGDVVCSIRPDAVSVVSSR